MYAGLLRPASVGLAISLFLPGIASAQKLVTGGGAGTSPAVRVFDASGTDQTFLAYPAAFPGGVRVALGDVTGDGVLDIITGAGPGGGPHVRVWNGTDLTEVGGFFAYDPAFPGGVFVAAGDVNGDGKADIITGAGAGGGPHVRIWDGTTFAEIGGFFAYDPAFPGGVTVAASDVDGDGRADIVTGAGPGGGPHVRVWSGADFHEIGGFFAYDPAFAGGVNVAAADIDGDGRAEIVTGAGPGGGPHVRVWNATTFAELGGFFAYDPAFPGGVVVGTVDLDRDGRYEIVTGPALGVPLVRLWTGDTFLLFGEYVAYSGSTDSGVFVGSSGGLTALRFTSTTSTTFAAGSAGTFAVTTVGGASVPALTLTGTLPAGVAFTDNGDRTGTLAGTPGATTGGSYPLTFTATISGRPPVTQSFTLTVNQAPAITSGNATTFSLGAPGTFTVATTGVPTPQLTVAGPLPSGVTFIDNGDGTGTLSGTPASGTGGTYVLAISASNGIGTGTIQNFTLTVSGAPAITSAATTTFTVGSAGTFTVTAVGTPTPTLTVTGALPAGVTFVDNGNGTGTLSGTPAAGTGGAHTHHLHRIERRPAERHASLHAERQSAAGHHERGQHDVHRRRGRIVHRHHERLPRGGADTGWWSATRRRDVRRQRQRHRHVEWHARRRHWRHIRDYLHRHEHRRRHCTPGLHADRERRTGHHQRGDDDVHRWQRRHVHGDRRRYADTSPDCHRCAARGRDLRRQWQRHRHAQRHARGGHGRGLSHHLHGVERRPAERHASVYAERQSNADDHEREQHDVLDWRGRIVHRHHERLSRAGPDAGRRRAAIRRHVRGQR